MKQGSLFEVSPQASRTRDLCGDLRAFREHGTATECATTQLDVAGDTLAVPTFVNEFWTARQRAAHSLHEVSYRACFKPQLPRFFVERLTASGDLVYDPFMGRGTTLIEAALLGRRVAGCDVNPVASVLCGPRLAPPEQREVLERLRTIDWQRAGDAPDDRTQLPDDLLVFFHPETLREIVALRAHLAARRPLDRIDAWIEMVAVNRLTGHSPGFFSVYTLPPNQATSVEAQRKINERRRQTPLRRDVPALIARKSAALLKDMTGADRGALAACAPRLLCGPSAHTPELADGSVSLVVTSPPFLTVVDYAGDNWLRCWFCGIDAAAVPITMLRQVKAWQAAMRAVFDELARVVRPGGFVAFEVGEVNGGAVRLDEAVLPVAAAAGFVPQCVQINRQQFTKTANCWGVANNERGTNTNRIVVLRRP